MINKNNNYFFTICGLRKTNYKKSIVFLKKIKKIFNIKNGITNKQILGIKSAGKIW